MSWPTFRDCIEFLKELRRVIWGNPLYKLAALLITIGAAMAGGASIYQVSGAVLLSVVNEKLERPIDPQVISESVTGALGLGIVFVIGGIGLWVWAYRREERIKTLERPAYELVIRPVGKDNWMRPGGEKYEANSQFGVTAAFTIAVGDDDLHLDGRHQFVLQV